MVVSGRVSLAVLKPELRSWEMPSEQLILKSLKLDELFEQAQVAFPETDTFRFERLKTSTDRWQIHPSGAQERSQGVAPALAVPHVPPYLYPWLSGMTLGLVLACCALCALTVLTSDTWPVRQRWQLMSFGFSWAGVLCAYLFLRKWRVRLSAILLRLAAALLFLAVAANLVAHWRGVGLVPLPALFVNLLLLISAGACWGAVYKQDIKK